jgi:hypothetical protein
VSPRPKLEFDHTPELPEFVCGVPDWVAETEVDEFNIAGFNVEPHLPQ